MKFSKEPVVWIAALIIVAQTIQTWLQGGEITPTIINNCIVVVGALFARKKVAPVAKNEE